MQVSLLTCKEISTVKLVTEEGKQQVVIISLEWAM